MATPHYYRSGAATIAAVLMTTLPNAAPANAQSSVYIRPQGEEKKLSAQVTVTRGEYNGWNDVYKLSNGTADMVIVPQIARIMRFGFVDAPNLFWNNDAESGKLGDKSGTWRNFGGDKPWPWSQDDWIKWFGASWPPPPEADQLPQKAEIVGASTLRLTSQTIPKIGCRIVREITLAETGARLYVTTRLERVTDTNTDPVAAWTITQTPYTRTPIAARLYPGSTTLSEGWRNMSKDEVPKSVRRSDDGAVLMVERDPEAKSGRKIGFDGDSLSGAIGDTVLSIRADSPGATGFDWRPGDRGQIYISDSGSPYIEWEFTSPMRALKKGESVTLSTTFEAVRLPADVNANTAVEAAARGKKVGEKKK